MYVYVCILYIYKMILANPPTLTQNDSICLETEEFSQTSPVFLKAQCLAVYGQNSQGT